MSPAQKGASAAEHYRVVRKLGEGGAAQVFLVRRNRDKLVFAMKVINKNDECGLVDDLIREIEILRSLDHPRICRLVEWYDEPTRLILISEACTGGELFDHLDSVGHFTEREAAKLVHQMVQALVYLHSKGVTHRDIKLENFVFCKKVGWDIKLIDFGLANKACSVLQLVDVKDIENGASEGRGSSGRKKAATAANAAGKTRSGGFFSLSRSFGKILGRVRSKLRKAGPRQNKHNSARASTGPTHVEEVIVETGKRMTEFVGSSYYLAPEVIEQRYMSKKARKAGRGAYGEKIDMWALGVITVMLLDGSPPFDRGHTEDVDHIRAEQKRGVRFPKGSLIRDGSKAASFIRGCLTLDPEARMSATQAAFHPWILENDGSVLQGKRLTAKDEALDHVHAIERFSSFTRMKRVVLMLVAHTLETVREHEKSLRDYFLELDSHQTGRITVEELREGLKRLGVKVRTPSTARDRSKAKVKTESDALSDAWSDASVDVEFLFSCLDEDCTGRVRYSEYLAAMTAEDGTSERLPAETIEDAFRRLNVDGADGLITQASLARALPGWDASQIRAMIEEIDEEGTGTVTRAKFERVLQDPGGVDGMKAVAERKKRSSSSAAATNDGSSAVERKNGTRAHV
jgi:serine/threonine protein kinase